MPLFIVICLKTSHYWLPTLQHLLSLAGGGIESGGHFRELLFSWLSLIYTRGILIIKLLFVFLLLICFLLQGGSTKNLEG